MKLVRSALTSTLILAVAACVLIGANQPAMGQGLEDKIEKDEREQILRGQVPPDFSAIDMDGNELVLSDMAGETPLVLDFWATWCPPCRMEIPLLNQFASNHEGEVMVVGITSEAAESESVIREFVGDQNLVFRIIHDPSGEISESYFVTAIPFLVVIDTEGTVVATHLGYSETIIAELEEELGLEPTTIEEKEHE